MKRILVSVCLLLVLFYFGGVYAQHLLRGAVRDATTGEGLSAATVQVKGTYQGTIANEDGAFVLDLPQFPATIRVTYIGYESKEVIVADSTATKIEIRLIPAPFVMPETIVTGEDPAVRIMREVIRRKQEWRSLIRDYQVEAYSRFVLENDTSIIFIGEVASEIYWDREKGFREVIKSKRATDNAEAESFNFGSTDNFINLYDDDIDIIENQVIGPTHPDALRHYNFEIVGKRQMDDKIVYDISVRPKSRLQAAFVGRIAILDEEFGMLEAELQPVKAISTSIPIPLIERFEFSYEQQFRPFDQGVWLPVDFRYEIEVKIGMVGLHFPLIKVSGISRLTNYRVNVALSASGDVQEKVDIALSDTSDVREEVDVTLSDTSDVREGIDTALFDASDVREEIDAAQPASQDIQEEIDIALSNTSDVREEINAAQPVLENVQEIDFSLSDTSDVRKEIDVALSDTSDIREEEVKVDTLISTEGAGVRVEVYARNERVQVDTQAVEADSLYTRLEDKIPLSIREQDAYTTIDSTMSPEEAFRPTGFLARFVVDDEEKGERSEEREGKSEGGKGKKGGKWKKIKKNLRRELWYNRVDAVHVGIGVEKWLNKRNMAHARGGYNTGLKRWFYRGGAKRLWGEERRGWLEGGYQVGTQTRYKSDYYQRVHNSVLPLLGFADYFDYYWGRGLSAGAGYRFEKVNADVGLWLRDEEQNSVGKNTDFDLLRRERIHRLNPPIEEGRLRSLELEAEWGDDYTPFGVTANRRAKVEIEHSAGWLGSDFSFTHYHATLDWHFKTWFRRRFAPNALDLRLVAGSSSGELPVQRFGALDVAVGPFTPFGGFRSLRGNPYEGERYAALFWEHNFRSVPFEFLGLWSLVRRGMGLVVHGASGRTWISTERRKGLGYEPRYVEEFHHEMGVSLLLYHIFRLDVTKRLDRDDWGIGVSIARFDFD